MCDLVPFCSCSSDVAQHVHRLLEFLDEVILIVSACGHLRPILLMDLVLPMLLNPFDVGASLVVNSSLLRDPVQLLPVHVARGSQLRVLHVEFLLGSLAHGSAQLLWLHVLQPNDGEHALLHTSCLAHPRFPTNVLRTSSVS